MKVIQVNGAGSPLPGENTCLALGFFDGIHRGHRRLITEAVKIAQKEGLKSGVFSFMNHPGTLFNPGKPFHYLTTPEEKEKLLRGLAVDYLFLARFDREFSTMSPADFFKELLIKTLKAKVLVVGKDYKFGFKGEGNAETLKKWCKEEGLELKVTDYVELEGEIVHSTRIRYALGQGDMEQANRFLGYYYFIESMVTNGKNRGTKIGIPTANLLLPGNKLLPPSGVYCFAVELKKEIYQGVGSIGSRPTFGEFNPTLEIHILDFKKNIYGEKIRVFPLKRVRDIKKFQSAEELVLRIGEDIRICRECFSGVCREKILSGLL